MTDERFEIPMFPLGTVLFPHAVLPLTGAWWNFPSFAPLEGTSDEAGNFAIAGLWPWGTGKIFLPDRSRMMFMPQRPYLPLGTLRAAICYPGAPNTFDDDAVSARFVWLFPNVALSVLPNHAFVLVASPEGPGSTIESAACRWRSPQSTTSRCRSRAGSSSAATRWPRDP